MFLKSKNSLVLIAMTVMLSASIDVASQTVIDGKEFKSYNRRYFRPHQGIFYSLYASPVFTVDPLNLGGKSTYGFGAGTRIALWQSRSTPRKLDGLKIVGLYTGVGYEFYPLQYDKVYWSFLWIRIKTVIPIVARFDLVYAFQDNLRGTGTRYSFGFEVKKIALIFTGEVQKFYSPLLGWHPATESDYANQGSIALIIPLYQRKPKP